MEKTKGQKLGRRAEWAALLLLMVKGYRPRHRNWRGGGGEIDLVVRKRDTTVFVEVKARSDIDFGGAGAHFDRRKREVLTRASSAYLSRFNLWQSPCRYDLVTIERVGGLIPWRIRHFKDVFQPNLGRQF